MCRNSMLSMVNAKFGNPQSRPYSSLPLSNPAAALVPKTDVRTKIPWLYGPFEEAFGDPGEPCTWYSSKEAQTSL